MSFELFLNLVILAFALYGVFLDLKIRYRFAKNAKKTFLEYRTTRKCTKKEKELLKKFYNINLKGDSVCSMEFPLLIPYTNDSFIFLNGTLAHCGPCVYDSNRTIKKISFVYHRRRLYILENEDTSGNIVTLEEEIKQKEENFKQIVDEENKEYGNKEGKPWFYGFKISLFSFLLTICFLISLNYFDIFTSTAFYFSIYLLAYIYYLKEKQKTFYELRQHNKMILFFTLINFTILCSFLYDFTDIKLSIKHYLNKDVHYINFKRDINKKPLQVSSKLYMSGYRLCATKRCNKFIVLDKDFEFKYDSLIMQILENKSKLFFKTIRIPYKEYLQRLLYRKSYLYNSYKYSLENYKEILLYLEKFKKYDLKSLNQLIESINKIVKTNNFIYEKNDSLFKSYSRALYNFKYDLFKLEKDRLRSLIKKRFDKAKTIFVSNAYENINYFNVTTFNYSTYLYNFSTSKRMNDIHAVVYGIEKKSNKKYIKIITQIGDNYFKDNLIIFLLLSLNLFIILFNFISIFYHKRKGGY